MVKIIDYKQSESNSGKPFVSLKLQGGLEPIQSQQTGRFYLSAKTCFIATTLDVGDAAALVGSEMPGKVEKVYCDPYEYTIKETGEVVTLSHRFEYQPEEVSMLETVE
jgi:hypothetical protein